MHKGKASSMDRKLPDGKETEEDTSKLPFNIAQSQPVAFRRIHSSAGIFFLIRVNYLPEAVKSYPNMTAYDVKRVRKIRNI